MKLQRYFEMGNGSQRCLMLGHLNPIYRMVQVTASAEGQRQGWAGGLLRMETVGSSYLGEHSTPLLCADICAQVFITNQVMSF